MISGYCIAAASDSTRRKPHSVRQYFYRRFRRIFPPFWIWMICTVIFVGFVAFVGYGSLFSDNHNTTIFPDDLSVTQWIGNLMLIEIWRPYIFGGESKLFFGHIWTLCYEEQFYAVCGIALFIAPRRFFQLMAIVSFFVLMLVIFKYRLPYFPGFFFDGRWLLFALGVLVYYRLNYSEGVRGRMIDVLIGFLPLVALFFMIKRNNSASLEYFVGTIFALTINFTHRFDLEITNSRILKPIKYCGVMCYSLYLVHMPITLFISNIIFAVGIKNPYATLFFTVPICVAISILVGRLFYLYVEKRFLNHKTLQVL